MSIPDVLNLINLDNTNNPFLNIIQVLENI
jgi:hypothetical protein